MPDTLPAQHSFSAFFGAFHPALVHLPVGLIVFAALLALRDGISKHQDHHKSIVLLYAAGAISAWCSVVTGWFLADNGEYTGSLLRQHRWLGILTAVTGTAAWLSAVKTSGAKSAWGRLVLPGILLIEIVLTGHWGGSLTHGEGYLLENAPAWMKPEDNTNHAGEYAFEHPDSALAYQQVTAVMLGQKCVGCHGQEKQKGKLRLDGIPYLLQGGKHGAVIEAGNPGESELMRRLLLPRDDEEHMPPKEKPQLSAQELAYLHWWISAGADTRQSVGALSPPDSIRSLLVAMRAGKPSNRVKDLDIPEPETKADPALINSLEKAGLLLLPLSRESRNLQISFINCSLSADSLLALMQPLAPFIIQLDLAGKNCSDKGLSSIAKLTRLRTLHLSRTAITDQGLAWLSGLNDLERLNLSGTGVTADGLIGLQKLPKLQQVFLYQTAVKGTDLDAIRRALPKTSFDTGGYRLPLLESDTSLVRDQKTTQARD